jgi:CrcB protein
MSPLAVNLITVAIGGGIGCAARALVRDLLLRRAVESWLAIVIINLSGAAALGGLAAFDAFSKGPLQPWTILLPAILAGWTTYSAFSIDVVLLWLRGRRSAAGACWFATIIGAPAIAIAAHTVVGWAREMMQ